MGQCLAVPPSTPDVCVIAPVWTSPSIAGIYRTYSEQYPEQLSNFVRLGRCNQMGGVLAWIDSREGAHVRKKHNAAVY
jgi:hypothetical protein